MDTYNNLTLKTISMLEWAHLYCAQARYFFKTDDDMFINFPVLMPLLDAKPNLRRSIIGKVAKSWKPIRNTTSKYYILPQQYPHAVYPDFNTGPAYVMTTDILADLYRLSLDGTFFKLEDVYVTGIMAGQLKIQHVHHDQFYNRRPKKLDTCPISKMASVHMVKPFELYDLWKRLNDGMTTCPASAS